MHACRQFGKNHRQAWWRARENSLQQIAKTTGLRRKSSSPGKPTVHLGGKARASGLVGVLVAHDLGLGKGGVLLEGLGQHIIIDFVAQVAHEDAEVILGPLCERGIPPLLPTRRPRQRRRLLLLLRRLLLQRRLKSDLQSSGSGRSVQVMPHTSSTQDRSRGLSLAFPRSCLSSCPETRQEANTCWSRRERSWGSGSLQRTLTPARASCCECTPDVEVADAYSG